MNKNTKNIQREILLGFWKTHILHHAAREPVVGQWMLRELRHHGYELSPGTLYPLLARMVGHGWLRRKSGLGGGSRSKKEYRITPQGRRALRLLRRQVKEMYEEVVCNHHSEEQSK